MGVRGRWDTAETCLFCRLLRATQIETLCARRCLPIIYLMSGLALSGAYFSVGQRLSPYSITPISRRARPVRHRDGSRPRLRGGGRAAPVRLVASIDMGPVFDAADVQHPVVLKCAERDAIIAAARHAPSFELKP